VSRLLLLLPLLSPPLPLPLSPVRFFILRAHRTSVPFGPFVSEVHTS